MLNAVNTEHCTLRKKLPPAIKYSNLQGKNVVLGTITLDHSLYEMLFTKIFTCQCSSKLFQR